jgi:DNA-directed RNA polymerase specialized sigma24 family protein
MAVLLVHAWGWSVVDVSVTLSVSESSVRTHLARGLKRLRALLEVTIDADA